jgi:shikimate kinase
MNMTKPKRIFIIGHMGAGKSLRGEALAKKLGWQYIDANPGLERYIGRNLNEIVGKQGEEAFHQCEAEIISHYIGKEHVVMVMEEAVIATEKNRKLLSPEFVVYLKVSTTAQIERWPSGRSPLLPVADLKTFLDKQHLERDRLFDEVATLTIEPILIEEDVNKIIKALEE